MFRFCSFLLSLLLALHASAQEGPIRVIDGDTIDVGDTRIRLHGIDAPEMGQPCQTMEGTVLDCGAMARDWAAERYEGAFAQCDFVEIGGRGRVVAKCYVAGEDISERMVADGMALAYRRYSMDYDLHEKQAAVAGLGLHAMSVQEPAAYRSRGDAPPGDCIIKGNISGSGQIYHMPHNRDYGRTRINEARGERWFCTEAEAQAAGWRPARN